VKAIVAVLAFVAFAGTSAFAQARVIERAFPSGGTIVLDLSAGEYEITGSPDDRIRVEWEVGDGSQDADVDVRADPKARRATIRTDGPMSGFDVRIQLPRRSGISVRLSAGELTVRRLEGSKDVRVRAGEIDIQVGDLDRYRRVDASVTIGELSARPLRSEQGGFFRSLHWDGGGEYDLRASLTVGEVKLTD
jgi:hypothetical protein